MTMNEKLAMLLVLLGMMILLFGAGGCGHALNEATKALNAQADLMDQSLTVLEDNYEHDLQQAVAGDDSEPIKLQRFAAVKASYDKAFAAHRKFRKGWIVAAQAITTARAQEALGKDPSVEAVIRLVKQLLALKTAVDEAIREIGGFQLPDLVGGDP